MSPLWTYLVSDGVGFTDIDANQPFEMPGRDQTLNIRDLFDFCGKPST